MYINLSVKADLRSLCFSLKVKEKRTNYEHQYGNFEHYEEDKLMDNKIIFVFNRLNY